MKIFLIAGAVALLTAAAVQAQPVSSAGGATCLRGVDIRDTRTPDDKTIVFHMNDGTVWRNDLRNSCPQLNFNGFGYVVTPPDQICGNLQSIRVLQTGQICQLGAFTKVSPGDHD